MFYRISSISPYTVVSCRSLVSSRSPKFAPVTNTTTTRRRRWWSWCFVVSIRYGPCVFHTWEFWENVHAYLITNVLNRIPSVCDTNVCVLCVFFTDLHWYIGSWVGVFLFDAFVLSVECSSCCKRRMAYRYEFILSPITSSF